MEVRKEKTTQSHNHLEGEGKEKYLMKVRNSMSTQSHKILTKKSTKKTQRSRREDKIGKAIIVDKKRKYPRKCGTVCPRRILEIHGEGYDRRNEEEKRER